MSTGHGATRTDIDRGRNGFGIDREPFNDPSRSGSSSIVRKIIVSFCTIVLRGKPEITVARCRESFGRAKVSRVAFVIEIQRHVRIDISEREIMQNRNEDVFIRSARKFLYAARIIAETTNFGGNWTSIVEMCKYKHWLFETLANYRRVQTNIATLMVFGQTLRTSINKPRSIKYLRPVVS